MAVQVYDDINASHVATGYPGRTDLPAFHIFTLESTYPHTRQVMPPYRFGFYQVVLLENSADATLDMNAERLPDLDDRLLFASPEHVLAWVRGETQRGYILYFKDEMLVSHPRPISDEFPFFRLNELNSISVEAADKATLRDAFAAVLRTFTSDHPYRPQILGAHLLALLFDCKRLHDAQKQMLRLAAPGQALAFRFQQFVHQHFLTRRRVRDYADLLAVSPDYLGQVVRATLGKTPLSIIGERIILEAKLLLRYSNLDIAEIAAHLGYDEPTHFGRFFRRETGMSPREWRHRPM